MLHFPITTTDVSQTPYFFVNPNIQYPAALISQKIFILVQINFVLDISVHMKVH